MGELQGRSLELRGRHIARSVEILAQLADPVGVDVEADDVELPGQHNGQRQADIAEADNAIEQSADIDISQNPTDRGT